MAATSYVTTRRAKHLASCQPSLNIYTDKEIANMNKAAKKKKKKKQMQKIIALVFWLRKCKRKQLQLLTQLVNEYVGYNTHQVGAGFSPT